MRTLTGSAGRAILAMFTFLRSMVDKLFELVRLLLKSRKERAIGSTDDEIRMTRSAHPLREAYKREVNDLANKADRMRAEGKSPEEIARTLHADRRALGEKYKALTDPELLEEIYARNMQRMVTNSGQR